MDEEAEHPLLWTGLENSHSFQRVSEMHTDVEDFLYNHDYIPIRSTSVSIMEAESDLNIISDVDGVTIEWINLSYTSHIFHHLFILARGNLSLKNVYHLLRKHEDLTLYNDISRKVLKDCVGTSIYTDCGWQYILCLLPEFENSISYNQSMIRNMTCTWIRRVKTRLEEMFVNAIDGGQIRHTVEKNNVNDLSQVFILPEDSSNVLQMLQTCVDTVAVPQGFRRFVFSYRFGEKNRGQVDLPIARNDAVSRICVHVGVSIELIDESESLFWSRRGLETVIGNRGTLSTTCGLFECANYQSSLDGHSLDVSGKLKRISNLPERVQFVQLYADVPHCYPKTRYHPVSAAIIIPDGVKSASEALLKEACEYVSVIKSNFMTMTRSVCRLEFVTSLLEIKNSITGYEMVNLDGITSLITEQAMFVPFCSSYFMASLRQLGVRLCQMLQWNLQSYKRTSFTEAVWESYQCELAAEKILWGHPLSFQSREMSINLGPGIEIPSRCASDMYGFLKLENKFTSCIDEKSTPPLTIYSGSDCVRKQLKKMYGFYDRIDASSFIIGRSLIEVLLKDLYDIGSVFVDMGTYISSLKEGGNFMRIVGVTTKSQLAKQLSIVKKVKFPMVFLHLLKMLRDKDKDVEQTLIKGIEETQLCFFPAFRNADPDRNQVLFWQFSYGVWAIRDLNNCNCSEVRGNLLCALVLNELESRKLCYTRSLNGTNEYFPWVKICLRKLQELNLGEDELVLLMTFVTCVAFLERGQFVEYDKLRALVAELPLSQRRLRSLEIQDQFLVNNMNVFKVWRLHSSIPRSTPKRQTPTTFAKPDENSVRRSSEERSVVAEFTEKIDENSYQNMNSDSKVVMSGNVPHRPTGKPSRWDPQELSILHKVSECVSKSMPVLIIYSRYQEECRTQGIPDRSFAAFRAKYKRL